jgi:hypothetical protein
MDEGRLTDSLTIESDEFVNRRSSIVHITAERYTLLP